MSEDKPTTYHQMAIAALDEAGGRYARRGVETIITGKDAPSVDAVAWSKDLASLPKEPPLNEDINALPDLTLAAPAADLSTPSVPSALSAAQPPLSENQTNERKENSDE